MIKSCASCTDNKRHQKMFCDDCGKVQEIKLGSSVSIFDVFGFDVSLDIDKEILDKKYSELITLMHPDKFAHATGDEKSIAEANTATINKAYSILSSEVEIYDYILSDIKGVSNDKILEDDEEFLLEKIHLYEELSSITSTEKCINFRNKLNETHSRSLIDIRKNISKKSWGNAAKELAKLRFIQNLINIVEKKEYVLEMEEKTLRK
jgi:molecular chaperone HscB